jgi:hypothetical protein
MRKVRSVLSADALEPFTVDVGGLRAFKARAACRDWGPPPSIAPWRSSAYREPPCVSDASPAVARVTATVRAPYQVPTPDYFCPSQWRTGGKQWARRREATCVS